MNIQLVQESMQSGLYKWAVNTTLKPHQQAAVDHLKRPGVPGSILYYGLGSGKSLTALAAAEPHGGANIVTPASLRENMKKEIKKWRPEGKYTIHSYESFVKHPPKDLSSRALIFDESQKLRNPESKRRNEIFDLAQHAKKRILLSGTPIQNSPHELGAMINLAAGRRILPDNEKSFNERYVEKREIDPGFFRRVFLHQPTRIETHVKNKHELKMAVKDLVLHYQPDKNDPNYPTVKHETEKVPMHDRQVLLHKALYQKLTPFQRFRVNNALPSGKKDLASMNHFMNVGRQIANTTETLDSKHLPEHDSKLNRIVENISKAPGPSLAYSNFLDSGIKPLSRKLTERGIPHHIFTGEMNDKQKKQVVSDYNSGKVRALLLSSAGGEGLDLKGTREVHIMEPHWHDPKIDQVIGRSARFGSHTHLPKDQRNVRVRHYISVHPRGELPTADEYLHKLSKDKRKTMNRFSGILRDEGDLNVRH